jgi:hypothetical protein
LLASLLAVPAQADDLSLTNVRLTHGMSGPKRPNAKVLPGDHLIVSFDITGITTDESGKARYSISTELSDADGKVQFRQPPRDQEIVVSLGGGILPAFAQADVGLKQPAGDYSMKVTVTDRATGKSQSLTQPFTVLPPAFGAIRLGISRDPDGQLPILLPVAGDTVYCSLSVVGFQRDKPEGQPHVVLEIRVLDAKGKPTFARPTVGTVNKDVPVRDVVIPLQFPLTLNRTGTFTLELKLTDKISGKSIEKSAQFTVHGHQ